MVPCQLRFDNTLSAVVLTFESDAMEVSFEPASPEDAATLSATFADLGELVRRITMSTIAEREVVLPLPLMDLGRVPGVPLDRAVTLQLTDAELTISPEGWLVAHGKLRPALR